MRENKLRSAATLRNTFKALDRARAHESPDLLGRLEHGPMHFARGLGIAALKAVPGRLDSGAKNIALGRRSYVGAGCESLVFKEKGEAVVVKVTDVSEQDADARLDLLQRDLAVASEVFGDMLPQTNIAGIEYGSYGVLQGLFIVQTQEYVEGQPLLGNLESLDSPLQQQITKFLCGFERTVKEFGRIPDIIQPDNLLMSQSAGGARLHLPDYSMLGLDCELRPFVPDSDHGRTMSTNLQLLTEAANRPIES